MSVSTPSQAPGSVGDWTSGREYSALDGALPVDNADPARTVLAVGLAGAFAGVFTLLVVLALLGGVLQLMS